MILNGPFLRSQEEMRLVSSQQHAASSGQGSHLEAVRQLRPAGGRHQLQPAT